MSELNKQVVHFGLNVVLPEGATSVAFDENGEVYAFFDVPVFVDAGFGVPGCWSTTLSAPEHFPVYLGKLSEAECPVGWKDSLVIIDEEARLNQEEAVELEAFENAKQVN